MDIPVIYPYEEQAKGVVITVINNAKEKTGRRQTLSELVSTADNIWAGQRLCLRSIKEPIPHTAEKLIDSTIREIWQLDKVFKYCIKYIKKSRDEVSVLYYFEAIFSQPTAAYPIPQVTGSVFFRVEDQLIDKKKAPMMFFRIEGDVTDHDIRFVSPSPDWILALMQKKLKFFKRLEEINLF